MILVGVITPTNIFSKNLDLLNVENVFRMFKGSLVSEEEAPEIYKNLKYIGEKLNKILHDKYKLNERFGREVPVDFYIVKTNIPNAAITTSHQGKYFRQAIIITTEFLNLLMTDSKGKYTEDSIKKGYQMLASTVGHEYGHFLQRALYSNSEDIEVKRWFTKATKKSLETHADLISLDLLREGGFKQDAGVDKFKKIEAYRNMYPAVKPHLTSSIENIFMTHPQDDFRAATVRNLSTKLKFDQGVMPVENPKYDFERMKADLQKNSSDSFSSLFNSTNTTNVNNKVTSISDSVRTNKAIVTNKNVLENLPEKMTVDFIINHPEAYRQLFSKALTKALQEADLNITREDYSKLIHKAHNSIYSCQNGIEFTILKPIRMSCEDIETSVISKSQFKNKNKLLHYALFDIKDGKSKLKSNWYLKVEDNYGNKTLKTLVKEGIIKNNRDILDFTENPLKMEEPYYAVDTPERFMTTIILENSLSKELDLILDDAKNSKKGLNDLYDFIDKVIDPYNGQYSVSNPYNYDDVKEMKFKNSKTIQDFKNKILSFIRENPSMFKEKEWHIFNKLTATGPIQGSDTYFLDNFMFKFENGKKVVNVELGEQALKDKKIKSIQNQETILIEKLNKIVEDEKPMPPKTSQKWLEYIHKHMPTPSSIKDKIVEEFLWKWEINDRASVDFAQSLKSTNWLNLEPTNVDYADFFSERLKYMSEEDKIRLIDYFRSPKNGISKELEDAIKKTFDSQFLTDNSHVKIAKSQLFGIIFSELDYFAKNAAAPDKTFMIDLILNNGQKPLVESPSFYKDFLKRIKVKESSVENQLLDAYLSPSVTSPNDKSTLMSYLLSIDSNDGDSTRQIFEAHKSVGVKGGQLSSLFNIFPKEIRRQLAKLKDKAKPLDKIQILDILKNTLSEEDFKKIKLKKIIGSASIKTVIEVEIEEIVDGVKKTKEAVLAVQDPNAENQIKFNIEKLKKLIKELKNKNISGSTSLISVITKSLEEQMELEIDMNREREMIKKAQELYQNMNKRLIDDLPKNWTFEVPKVIDQFGDHSHLLFMEKAHGASFDLIQDSKLKEKVGRSIAKSGIIGLFEEGLLNADSHKGNFIIDVEKKTIYPIDFGQLEEYKIATSPFQRDEVYNLGQFIDSTHKGNARKSILFALTFSEDQIPKTTFNTIIKETDKFFKTTSNIDERSTKIIEILSEHGVNVNKKFSFGALKGLMVIGSEVYVQPDEMKNILEASIIKKMKEKKMIFAKDIFRRNPFIMKEMVKCLKNILNVN